MRTDMMLEEDVKDYPKSKAAESYSRGEKNIETAAKEARISVWEMIDYTQKHNITPPAEDLEELEREYAESKNT